MNKRPVRLEQLESRHLLAAAPLGATWKDTGEYLLGKVAVTTVFFESNGAIDSSTQDWSAAEIDQSINKVVEGVTWWSDLLDTLGTVHELEFEFDHRFAETPFETSFEPIERSSLDHEKYVSEFLVAQGYGGESSIENAMWRFNDDQRETMETDWSFTVFVVDSSDDDDGQFPAPGFPAAFALPGGLYMVVPSGRSASTVAHEMGHIFWALDEYPGGASWNARRGYYDVQNLNAVDDKPIPTQENSIMSGGVPLFRAYTDYTSPDSTLALVGWQDSDGDGVFDVLDVPLRLDVVGTFDAGSSSYHLRGEAAAVPLANRNSYGEHPSVIGTNSDITLNRISEIQYSLDGGGWVTASSPDQQVTEIDLRVTINEPFDSIRWRAIDTTTGITSEEVAGTASTPAQTDTNHRGYAFVDENLDGQRDAGEPMLDRTVIEIVRGDGTELPRESIDADDFAVGPVPDLNGVTLTLQVPVSELGPEYDPRLRSLTSAAAGGRRVFQAQEQLPAGGDGPARDRWAERKFVAEFDQPVGEVSMRMIGLSPDTMARVEAYDASGNLITRVTRQIGQGTEVTLDVGDRAGQIASVLAFGQNHTETGIAISGIDYGFTSTVVTDASGVWGIPHLPDGSYLARLTPERLIYQFDQPEAAFDVVGGSSQVVVGSARRVDSPRHNGDLAHDSNRDGRVTASDALVIINDLARSSARIIGPDEPDGFKVDVNNDGSATALDALLVINYLGRTPPAEGELGVSESSSATRDEVFAGWSTGTTGAISPASQIPQFESLAAQGADEMLDSAGRVTPGESNDHADADSDHQQGGGGESVPKRRVSRSLGGEKSSLVQPMTPEIAENVNEDSLENDSFQSENSEPLGPRLV